MPTDIAIETIRVGDITVLHAAPHKATHGAVLFIHGYFVDGSLFSEWLRFFAARGFPSYSVHLRGRAGSRPGTNLGRASIDDFVTDASDVARSLGAPLVVGHSMGGLIAQKLAELGLARAVALITPAPPRGITVLSPRLAIKQLKYLIPIFTSGLVHPSREDMREMVLNHTPRALQNVFLDRLIPDSGRAGRDMSITGVPVDASRVRCPMLVVGADDDLFIPKQIAARIAQRYHAPLHMMPDRGHVLVAEPTWPEVAEVVIRFGISGSP